MLRMHFNDISWGLLSLSQYSHITSPVTPPQKCPGPGSTCVKLPGPRAARSLVTAPVSQSRRILPVSAPVRAPDCQPQSEKSFPAVEPSLARAWRLRVGSYERERAGRRVSLLQSVFITQSEIIRLRLSSLTTSRESTRFMIQV